MINLETFSSDLYVYIAMLHYITIFREKKYFCYFGFSQIIVWSLHPQNKKKHKLS